MGLCGTTSCNKVHTFARLNFVYAADPVRDQLRIGLTLEALAQLRYCSGLGPIIRSVPILIMSIEPFDQSLIQTFCLKSPFERCFVLCLV